VEIKETKKIDIKHVLRKEKRILKEKRITKGEPINS
jgi:hypothetical protein